MFLLLFTSCSVEPPPLDLTVRLSDGEVRAGVVTDEDALFGGISAEGKAGDVKIYNSRVQFVIQSARDGSYYVRQGGAVIDADIVREENVPGRDLVDEWAGMFGLGRLMNAETVEVLEDGSTTGRAVVRVSGGESPMELITGALESPDFIPDEGLWITTEYVLEPDTHLLRIETTVEAMDGDASFEPGDLLIGALEAGSPWLPGLGLGGADDEMEWTGFMGERNDIALAIFAPPGGHLEVPSSISLLSSLTDMLAGFGPSVDLEEGDTTTHSRFFGVGADLASLTDDWLSQSQTSTETVEGVVTADDGPVAGARVNILAHGKPWTLAVTDENGAFSAMVPENCDPGLLASGRGTGRFVEHPSGAGHYGPYAAPPIRDQALDSLRDGAVPIPESVGRGVADPSSPLELGVPARLNISVVDGAPFTARLRFVEPDQAVTEGLSLPRPTGESTAIGWSRDGTLELVVEPGNYELLLHRGLRDEITSRDVSLVAGETLELSLAIEPAFELPPGWLVADPHVHASPSGDGGISLEDRAVVMSAVGVELLFGTDHDHITDYTPLLEAMSLTPFTRAVVGDEVSPVLRGHVQAYPLDPDPEAVNGGAWTWWNSPVESTDEQFELLRERHPNVLLQLNHPLDGGVAEVADWYPGEIGKGSFWTEDFDAVEVLNDGKWEPYLEFYLDVFDRGILSTPVGVSDSHSYTSGDPGVHVTFLYTGGELEDFDADVLVDAMSKRHTVVGSGVFLDLSILPGSEIVGGDTLVVEALGPSWAPVDTLSLLKNGEVIEIVEGTTATFDLSPQSDATYVVLANGETGMTPLFGSLPFAMSSPILVDVEGDGWTPPKPPLSILD